MVELAWGWSCHAKTRIDHVHRPPLFTFLSGKAFCKLLAATFRVCCRGILSLRQTTWQHLGYLLILGKVVDNRFQKRLQLPSSILAAINRRHIDGLPLIGVTYELVGFNYW